MHKPFTEKNGASRSINETLANYLEHVDLAEVQTPALWLWLIVGAWGSNGSSAASAVAL